MVKMSTEVSYSVIYKHLPDTHEFITHLPDTREFVTHIPDTRELNVWIRPSCYYKII